MSTGAAGAADEALAKNLYFDRQHGIDAAKILPGEYYVTRDDMVLVTVLGSCVAACIRDPQSGIGGMNHFMLPEAGGNVGDVLSASARYGAYAMELLINELVKLGARRQSLEAKVFGGGNVLPGMSQTNVGERNADFVLGFLTLEGIRLTARDLLDCYPRKIYFFPCTGRVRMKKLRTLHNSTILERELSYRERLSGTRVSGEIELFT